MKTNISSENGVVTELVGNGVSIEGVPFAEAPFRGRWEDLRGQMWQGTGQAALTYEPYRDTGFYMNFFRHNQSDFIFVVYQMPHSWDPTTNLRPHMHCIPMASGSGNAVFKYAWAWADFDDEFPPAVGWTSGSVSASWTPADQYRHKLISFGNVAPHADAAASSICVFKIERDPNGTYTTSKTGGTADANVAILDLDLHYQQLMAGTVDEFD